MGVSLVLCGHCGRARISAQRGGCACVPPSFWQSEPVLRAVQDQDAAAVIRLACDQLAGLSQEGVARMTGLASSTISRILAGAPLTRADRAQQALTGMGAPPPRPRTETAPSPGLGPVQRLLEQPECVDAAAVAVLGTMLAAQRRLDDHVGAEIVLPSARSHAQIMDVAADRARGPHAEGLRVVAAEWIQFEGWLLASTGRLHQAVQVLERAAVLAQELNEGTLLAQAYNFVAYTDRRRGDVPAFLSGFLRAYHTPGAHPAQRVGDAIQAAHGQALLGQREDARRLLDEAATLAEHAATLPPPPTAYWLNEQFHRLNLGLAHHGLGEADVAVDLISSGLAGLPADQRAADWTVEYREALERARQ
ncbi:hypothetical protein GCM10009642_65290 [Nocardiopsis metallicus]